MKKKSKVNKLVWLRGYRRHTLWDGKTRVGRITLWDSPERRGLYICEAGTLKRETGSLAEAKRWVRENVMLNMIQQTLF